MYAIVDIETTGGKFNEEGITEIAIYKYDGISVVDQFISLVNPEKPIQPFVVQLTGITNAMLHSAPRFHEVAKRIVQITEGCILVAHNAQFDYRILQVEFKRLGYDFQKNTLCTVELAKQLIPDLPSYSLGKLVRSLGIPMADRHRASGDAFATVKLFQLILSKDIDKTIVKQMIKTIHKSDIKEKLVDIIESLPTTTGVYYMHKENGELIYIGKSTNIRKRINQHFTATTKIGQRIQKEVFTVTYEETGSELIAILKETEEIKKHKPIHNRLQRRALFLYALYTEKDTNGYIRLHVSKIDGRKKEITAFMSIQEGQQFLLRIISEYQLCQKICGLYPSKNACFQYDIQECNGACVQQEKPELYNQRVNQFIDKYHLQNQNIILIDKGRKIEERTAVLIENGIYKGYAFFDLNYQVMRIDVLKNILIPMVNNRDTTYLIKSYIQKTKGLKVIRF